MFEGDMLLPNLEFNPNFEGNVADPGLTSENEETDGDVKKKPASSPSETILDSAAMIL